MLSVESYGNTTTTKTKGLSLPATEHKRLCQPQFRTTDRQPGLKAWTTHPISGARVLSLALGLTQVKVEADSKSFYSCRCRTPAATINGDASIRSDLCSGGLRRLLYARGDRALPPEVCCVGCLGAALLSLRHREESWPNLGDVPLTLLLPG